MDNFEIVRRLRRIAELKDSVSPPHLVLNRTIADASIYIDPSKITPYPSSSGNTVTFLGTEAPINKENASTIIDAYCAHGVNRFFVFVSPSPWIQQTMEFLSDAGLTPFNGPAYHTLVRNVSGPIPDAAPCDFALVRLAEDSPHKCDLSDPLVQSAVGRPEFDVWVAMAGDIVAGHGLATTLDSVTYLGGAGTSEPYRNRGVQTALIRARLQDAARRGSQVAVSETLSMLGSSLRNLQRAGFTIAYDKIVYQWHEE